MCLTIDPFERWFGSTQTIITLNSLILDTSWNSNLMSISNLTLSLSRFCCFLFYGVAQKGFRFYHLPSYRLMVSHHVVFKEYKLFKMKSKFYLPTFPLFSPHFHLQSWCPGRNAGTFGSSMILSWVSCFNGKLPAIATSTKRKP